MIQKNEPWAFHENADAQDVGNGVTRRILAYCDGVMTVENTFVTGGIGPMHAHPHTQITYVLSGKFEFTIGNETKIVTTGDTLLKQDGIEHGCKCLEAGKLLDIFTPMRKDFV